MRYVASLLGGLALSWLGTAAQADCSSDKAKCQLQCAVSNDGDCRPKCAEQFEMCQKPPDKARNEPNPEPGPVTPPAQSAPADVKKAPSPAQPAPISGQALANKAGCIPGASVAPFHATTFYSRSEGNLIADMGDPLKVDPTDPVTGERCNVSGRSRRGEVFRGAVALKDIGPLGTVHAALAARAYNTFEDVSLATFPQKLRAGLTRRAKNLNIDPEQYTKEIPEITNFVTLCSEITDEQLDAAMMERPRTLKSNETYGKYRQCETPPILGQKFGAESHGILVAIGLRSDTRPSKYYIRVAFGRKPELDGNRVVKGKSMKEDIYNFYDAYGVGNFSVSRN